MCRRLLNDRAEYFMTDTTTGNLNTREALARIDRTQAEAGKLLEETLKLVAEQHKLLAEQRKLAAEADKSRRDHGLAPWALAMATVGAATGLVLALVTALQRMGVF